MAKFPHQLEHKLQQRKLEGSLRQLSGSLGKVDFSSNDYLGFARNPSIAQRTHELLKLEGELGNGATGSRLLSGNHALYGVLENRLEQLYGMEALVFNSGYAANTGFFAAVPQRGDVVLYDAYIHASIRDGLAMGLATGYKFAHNNLAELEQRLQRLWEKKESQDREIYVVTEAVFSMDGDSPDLVQMAQLCETYGCHLVVDEAHALGLFGANGLGLVQQLGLQHRVFARIITFGKALGSHGAAVLGPAPLKSFLVNYARSFIYSTGLPPHGVASILAGLEQLCHTEGELAQKKLFAIVEQFREEVLSMGLADRFVASTTPIQCCVVPGNQNVRLLAQELQQLGYDVRPIMSPTVPKGMERLRFCLHGFNTLEEIRGALQVLAQKS